MRNSSKGSAKQRLSDKIKAGKITGRLQEFSLSYPGDDDYEKVHMSPQQVTAGFKLLAKVLPDRKQVEHSGKISHIVSKVERTIVNTPDTNS